MAVPDGSCLEIVCIPLYPYPHFPEDQIWAYNLSSDEWRNVSAVASGAAPSPRSECSAVYIGTNVWIYGGGAPPNTETGAAWAGNGGSRGVGWSRAEAARQCGTRLRFATGFGWFGESWRCPRRGVLVVSGGLFGVSRKIMKDLLYFNGIRPCKAYSLKEEGP